MAASARNELRGMNLQALMANLNESDQEFEDWMVQMGLLHR
jgi:hypothetical protein